MKKINHYEDKSMFARIEQGKIQPNDLKLNLSGAKNDLRYSAIENNNKGLNYYEDPRFNKILEEKKKLNKLKLMNKKKEMEKLKIKESEKWKIKKEKQEREKEKKQKKAKIKIQEVIDKRRARQENLKSSLSYKFLKGTIPLFKQIEQKMENTKSIKIKPEKKNHRVPLEEIMTHSKIIKMKQMEKQKER
jgi:hypothetical protein